LYSTGTGVLYELHELYELCEGGFKALMLPEYTLKKHYL